MTSPPPQIDIVTVVTALAALVFSQELADVIGPYSVIVVGAILGGAIATGRRKKASGFWRGAGFLLAMVTLALLCTVPVAMSIANHSGVESRWLLGPVAVLIAGIGPDWPRLCVWVATTLIDRLGPDWLRAIAARWSANRGANP